MYGSPEHIRKVIEDGGESYLKSFGLDWNFLLGKKILDAGAAQGEFAAAAKLHARQ